MKILIVLQSTDSLVVYEGLSLAFVLAGFDYHIALQADPAIAVLLQEDNRIAGMVQAIALYGIECIWVKDLAHFADILPKISVLLRTYPANRELFDSILTF